MYAGTQKLMKTVGTVSIIYNKTKNPGIITLSCKKPIKNYIHVK